MAIAVKVVQAGRNTKQIHLFLFTKAMVTAPTGLMPAQGGVIASPILKTTSSLLGAVFSELGAVFRNVKVGLFIFPAYHWFTNDGSLRSVFYFLFSLLVLGGIVSYSKIVER